jgi:hypothetical protein
LGHRSEVGQAAVRGSPYPIADVDDRHYIICPCVEGKAEALLWTGRPGMLGERGMFMNVQRAEHFSNFN